MFNSRFKNSGFRVFSSRNNKSFSEDHWIELIRSGDPSVFESIFRTYYPYLCQFAYRSVESPDIAEDIVQSVFLNIWKNRREWNPQCSVRMYLYKATRNQVINYLKHKNIEKKVGLADIHSLRTDVQTPESKYIQNEYSKAIHDTIDRLPERCRLIFLMKKEDGLKYTEIAEILGISIKTVETQMVRALRYLRENLAEYI
jgi:RNA polymerase sigma-70 factor, ECF subfamily